MGSSEADLQHLNTAVALISAAAGILGGVGALGGLIAFVGGGALLS